MPRIIIPGSYQSQAIRYSPPDTAGLEYWGMFGTSNTFSGRNHAPGKDPAIVTGVPTYATDSMAITPSAAFISTNVGQTPAQTLIAVAKVTVEDSTATLVGNGPSPSLADPAANARGASLVTYVGTASTGKVSLAATMSVSSGGVDTFFNALLIETLPLNSWAFLACSMQSNGQYKAYNLTSGASATAVASGPYNPGSGKFRVGAPASSANSDPISMAMAAIYSVVKTDAQIISIYNVMKAYYASRGIAI